MHSIINLFKNIQFYDFKKWIIIIIVKNNQYKSQKREADPDGETFRNRNQLQEDHEEDQKLISHRRSLSRAEDQEL